MGTANVTIVSQNIERMTSDMPGLLALKELRSLYVEFSVAITPYSISGDLYIVIIDRTIRQETDADLLLPMR
jgi:hypothetical protein